MALPGNHTFNTLDVTGYTPSCGGTPVAVYIRVPVTGTIRKFTGILGGAITTGDGTVTVTNVTQSTTVGTYTITQSGSAAGQYQFGTPTTIAVSQVNEDDIIKFLPSGASGATIPLHVSLVVRAGY